MRASKGNVFENPRKMLSMGELTQNHHIVCKHGVSQADFASRVLRVKQPLGRFTLRAFKEEHCSMVSTMT